MARIFVFLYAKSIQWGLSLNLSLSVCSYTSVVRTDLYRRGYLDKIATVN